MFDLFKAIIFGATQGITEFLPISSSGHLLVLHNFFDLPIKNELAFDVALHFSSLLAVILFFRKDISKLFFAFINGLFGKTSDLSKVSWMIIVGTIPAALAGLFLEDIIEDKLRLIIVVAFMLFAVAILFILVEKFNSNKSTESYSKLSFKNAMKIGLAQTLALIPGTSRSGITIITGMSLGLKREEAIKFSFLLSIPIILGASATKIPEFLGSLHSGSENLLLILAFLSCFISAFLTIKIFLKFAKNNTLIPFAYYRIILSVILIIFWFLGK